MLLTSGKLECSFEKAIEKFRRAKKNRSMSKNDRKYYKFSFFQKNSALNCCYGHVEFSFDNTDRLFFHKTRNGFGRRPKVFGKTFFSKNSVFGKIPVDT